MRYPEMIDRALRGDVSPHDAVAVLLCEQGPGDTMVHAILLAKRRFHSKRVAQTWAANNDWNSDIVEETDADWRLIQEPETTFSAFSTVQIEDGVQMVRGTIKRAARAPTGDLPGVRP